MELGDVHWVDFPPPSQRVGHAQAGTRPAVVLQSAEATVRLPTVLVVPFTTQIETLRFPHTFEVQPDATNGLTRPSVVLVFQLTAMDRSRIKERMGRLSDDDIDFIFCCLDALTGRLSPE